MYKRIAFLAEMTQEGSSVCGRELGGTGGLDDPWRIVLEHQQAAHTFGHSAQIRNMGVS